MKQKPLNVHVEDAWTYELPPGCIVTCRDCSGQVDGIKQEKSYGWVGEAATKRVWELLKGAHEKRLEKKIHITHSAHIKFGPRGIDNCQICAKEFDKRGENIIITDTTAQE